MKHHRKMLAVLLLGMACSIMALAEPATGNAEEEHLQPLAETPHSLVELLGLVREGRVVDAREAREREARFLADRETRQQELERTRAELRERQQRSAALEKRFESNARQIGEREQRMRERLGPLAELLGQLTAVAGEARDDFAASLSSAEFGASRVAQATALIDRIGTGVELPTIAELEGFWYELQREMAAAGEVRSFEASVVRPDGSEARMPVVRVGVFDIIDTDGHYLQYDASSGVLSELSRQPARRFTAAAAVLARSTQGTHVFAIDPTGPSGGSYLAALTAAPSFAERIRQGGMIGYVIMVLGVVGAALAVYRHGVLLRTRRLVDAQLASAAIDSGNPLGRVLAVWQMHPELDGDALELKLSEAVIRELPGIERGLSLLRIIATVAPLLGLLGTVTGMILTFQSITIFGAGDPKAMAGGISQALVTTVQGLCVAIPIVFAHALISGQVRRLTQILEEEVSGIVAERSAALAGLA